jgi:hypothetical protein
MTSKAILAKSSGLEFKDEEPSVVWLIVFLLKPHIIPILLWQRRQSIFIKFSAIHRSEEVPADRHDG